MKNILTAAILITLMGLVACTESSNTPEETACNVLGLEERSFNPKIMNGKQCSVLGSPVVELTITLAKGGGGVCSGTLITPNRILTASHCFVTGKSNAISSMSALVEGRDVPVSGYAVHPKANLNSEPTFDVAIADLSSPVGAPTLPLVISPILQPGDLFSIFGYGVDSEEVSGVLRSGQMNIQGVNSQYIQAKYASKGSSTCHGDSGGPAVFQFHDAQDNEVAGIIGVTSFGSANCEEDGTVYFANVQNTEIYSWILSVVPEAQVR